MRREVLDVREVLERVEDMRVENLGALEGRLRRVAPGDVRPLRDVACAKDEEAMLRVQLRNVLEHVLSAVCLREDPRGLGLGVPADPRAQDLRAADIERDGVVREWATAAREPALRWVHLEAQASEQTRRVRVEREDVSASADG